MSSLGDHLTKDSVQRLYDKFVEGVGYLPRTKTGDIKLNMKTFPVAGPPIIRFVHARMWQEASPNNTRGYSDYPMVYTGSVDQILRDEGVTHANGNRANLGGDVARIMQAAGIARFVRNLGWFLKPYDESRVEWVAIQHRKDNKVDYRDEKRMEEEATKAETTTKTRIDLRSIKRPTEFTPEQVQEFIERFVPSALKLQERYEKLQEVHEALLAEVEKSATEEQWAGVADAIEKAFS